MGISLYCRRLEAINKGTLFPCSKKAWETGISNRETKHKKKGKDHG
uniref:Uncharacterized protein n=1 Tax=Rhizophora mucronata TaxID=61149 RepID=A0A2P2QDB3_RHIMU